MIKSPKPLAITRSIKLKSNFSLSNVFSVFARELSTSPTLCGSLITSLFVSKKSFVGMYVARFARFGKKRNCGARLRIFVSFMILPEGSTFNVGAFSRFGKLYFVMICPTIGPAIKQLKIELHVGIATASDKAPSEPSGSTIGAKAAAVPKPPVKLVEPSITASERLNPMRIAAPCAITFCKTASSTAQNKNFTTFKPPFFKIEKLALNPMEVKNITIQ